LYLLRTLPFMVVQNSQGLDKFLGKARKLSIMTSSVVTIILLFKLLNKSPE